MKKTLVILLFSAMLLSLCACSNSDSQVTDPSSSSHATTDNTEKTTDGTEGTTGITQAPTEAPTTLPTTCSHSWQEATCTTPKTCSKCGATEGSAAGHSWKDATCTAPKTCAKCDATEGSAVGHEEVIKPAKHATFSVPGLTEGSYCKLCGKTIKEQVEIPALGSDMAVGTDYYDKTGDTTFRYSYSFTLYENNRFNLTTLKVGSDESYELTGEEGEINYLDNGVYELIFDSGKDRMFGKIADGQFQFCNKDGSKWKDKETRPQGTTKTPITPRPGNSAYGYNDLAHNKHGESMQELYYRLFAACEAFVDNKKDISAVDGKYIIDRINLDYYVLTADEAVAVWKVFYMENPRYYWLANEVSLTGGILNVCIDPAYSSSAYRATCDKAIENLAAACAQKLGSGISQLQKTLLIHDFVLGQMNYAYKKDGATPETAIWAHNLIGCAEKRAGVCESYAKTYQYLCLLNGVECIVVTGYNGEDHAWNVVKIDGKWYGVDCTFDETNGESVSYNCFGMSADRMNTEYTADTPDGSGIDYLYQIPKLAEQGIELVELYKNGEYVGVCANVDAAFSAMKDAKAVYEVRLFNYTRKGALLLSSAAVEHRITSTQTPKVQSIVIRGSKTDLGNGYYGTTVLTINKKLTLNCDLDIYDLDIYGSGSFDIKSWKLSCLGYSVQVDVPVTGSMDSSSPSELHLGATERVEFWKEVKVHTLSDSAEFTTLLQFRNHTTIAKCEASKISIFDNSLDFDENAKGISVQIGEYCPVKPAPSYAISPAHLVDIQGPANVKVGKITDPSGVVSIQMKFGKLKEFAAVTIGSSDTAVELLLEGKTTTIVTDVNGNEVNSWEETVDPQDLKVPIATLLDKSVMNKLRIYFVDWSKEESFADHTEEYVLNSKNQVVLKKD